MLVWPARRRALLRRRITASGRAGLMRRRPARVPAPKSGFASSCFPPEGIMVAVRWYLRYGLSYRDVEELLAERGNRRQPHDDLPVDYADCGGERAGQWDGVGPVVGIIRAC
jgi:hypothetical protein